MTTLAERFSGVDNRSGFAKVGYVLLVLPLVAVVAFVIFQPIQVLPRMDLAPGFSLVDQAGARLTNEDLRGKFVVYTITHSRCGEGCVDTTPSMGELVQMARGLDLGGVSVAFVSISVDPGYDTPERLSAYADKIGADGEKWRLVTGEPIHLKQIVGAGFGTYFDVPKDNAPADEIAFDPVFVLVDGWGIQRAVYRTATPEIDTVSRDLTLLAREVENSEGVNRFAYEAAHLFLCYPG